MWIQWMGRTLRTVVFVFVLAGGLRAGERRPIWVHPTSPMDSPVLVYPPADTSKPAELVVMLHGMCGHPENECPWFAGAATSDVYVACPRADLSCNGGATIWSGASGIRTRVIASVRSQVEGAFVNGLDTTIGSTLIGFSLGAFVALDVAEHSHGEWKRLLLIGAFVKPNAKKLNEAGVESVLLASGDWDMSQSHMKRQARLLEGRGVRARYVGMGPVGHRFAKDMDAWLRDAFAWLELGARKAR
jgi:predicted esterase